MGERRHRSEEQNVQLEEKIRNKSAVVGVVGLGYVGLPLVREFCRAGYPVVGLDIDPVKIERLHAGQSYIAHIASQDVQQLNESGRFRGTTDFGEVPDLDVIIICVPTPLTPTREPDLSYVCKTTQSIAAGLRTGQLVVLESTTYPCTTDDVVKPILEEGGLKCGEDFFLAFSPEREDPGNKNFSTGTIPKIVGGVDPMSGKLAQMLYADAVKQVVPVASAKVAEAAKILENIYRSVNIALVNELKVIFDRMGIDVWEVIDAAATKPFGFQAFYPGPGLGGHCIPIDPFYLAWKAKEYGLSTKFIELAGEVNTQMPHYVVQRITEALNERGKAVCGSKILMLGVAYKKDVDDMRESPATKLIELLGGLKAEVSYNDPHIPRFSGRRHYEDLEMVSVPLDEARLGGYDCVVIATNHTAYDYDWIVRHSRLVVDTRNATKGVEKNRERIVKA